VGRRQECYHRVLAQPSTDDALGVQGIAREDFHQRASRRRIDRPDSHLVRLWRGARVHHARGKPSPPRVGAGRTRRRGPGRDARWPSRASMSGPVRGDRACEAHGTSDPPAHLCRLKKKLFASWDRFEMPMPFSRACFVWGSPIWVSQEADSDQIEAKRMELETTLNQMGHAADLLVETAEEPPKAGDF